MQILVAWCNSDPYICSGSTNRIWQTLMLPRRYWRPNLEFSLSVLCKDHRLPHIPCMLKLEPQEVIKRCPNLASRVQFFMIDSGNTALGEAFTHTHIPYPKKTDKKVLNKPNHLSPNVNELLAFGQIVFSFLCVHYSNKTNKKLRTSRINFYWM